MFSISGRHLTVSDVRITFMFNFGGRSALKTILMDPTLPFTKA